MSNPALRISIVTLAFAASLAAVLPGCASKNKNDGAVPVGGATTPAPAGGTPNAWCESYCQKMAQCWSSVPSDNPSEPPDQVLADCHQKTNNCQVAATTDIMCCSVQADCTNFAACAFSAKNVPSTCQ